MPFMDVPKKLGIRIRKLRQQKKLSQEDLALEADLHRTYITLVESGRQNITVGTLCKIAKVLDILPGEILGDIHL
jgi:transcriptional regulator with XRE-family HTH domain